MNIEDISVEEIKELLRVEIESTADWRLMKACKYPDDKRNANCAEALLQVSELVKQLSVTHDLFLKLAAIETDECWREHKNWLLSRWGFFNGTERNSASREFVSSSNLSN